MDEASVAAQIKDLLCNRSPSPARHLIDEFVNCHPERDLPSELLKTLDDVAATEAPDIGSRALFVVSDVLFAIAIRKGESVNLYGKEPAVPPPAGLDHRESVAHAIAELARLRSGLLMNGDYVQAINLYRLASQALTRVCVETVRQRMHTLSSSEAACASAAGMHTSAPMDTSSLSVFPAPGVWSTATAPARLDLFGGWSDTPPMTYEHGGSVVNVALALDGRHSVGSAVRLTPLSDMQADAALITIRQGVAGGHPSGDPIVCTCRELSDLVDYNRPENPGSLVKAVLLALELVSLASGTPLRQQMAAFTAVDPSTATLALTSGPQPSSQFPGPSSLTAPSSVTEPINSDLQVATDQSEAKDSAVPLTADSSSSTTTSSAHTASATPAPRATLYALEVQTWCALKQGTGLGVSSILAATLIAAIGRCLGRNYSKDFIVHAVLLAEQLLSTGGGWQDQVGGIYGGFKLTHAAASLPFAVVPLELAVDPAVVTSFNQHLLVVHTGVSRLAKNLLQTAVMRWQHRSASVVQTLDRLCAGCSEMAAAIVSGDIAQIGVLLAEYWQLKQVMAESDDTTASATPVNPTHVEVLTRELAPFISGASLAGAGGGGFMAVITKKPVAEVRAEIEQVVERHNARHRASSGGTWSDITLHTASVDVAGLTLGEIL